MNRNDIDKFIDDQQRHRRLFGDQFDHLNSRANQALMNLQRELDRPNSLARQALEAIKQDLNRPQSAAIRMLRREMERPNHAINDAMKAILEESRRPNRAALEVVRKFQEQMTVPSEQAKALSRSLAEVSSHLALKKDWLRDVSNALAPAFAPMRDITHGMSLSQADQISKVAADLGRRQAELLATSWGPAAFASSLRTPEIGSMFDSLTRQFAKNNAAAFGSLSQNVFESIRSNETLKNLDFLSDKHFTDLALRVGEAVESSGNEDELTDRLSAIVGEDLEKSDKSRFTTFERISIAFLVVMFVLAAYAAVLQTLQYVDSSRPKPAPVIRIDFLRHFQRDFLERYLTSLQKDGIEIEYLIERDVALLSAPRWKSARLGTAIEGSRALLFDRNHKWIFAQVFHPLEDTSQFGWLNKKYSKRIA
jgi:hypothetical protein